MSLVLPMPVTKVFSSFNQAWRHETHGSLQLEVQKRRGSIGPRNGITMFCSGKPEEALIRDPVSQKLLEESTGEKG